MRSEVTVLKTPQLRDKIVQQQKDFIQHNCPYSAIPGNYAITSSNFTIANSLLLEQVLENQATIMKAINELRNN